jgi:DMSO/TMAO reductase YedYZ molybdopterin-dependent catalytic subunit
VVLSTSAGLNEAKGAKEGFMRTFTQPLAQKQRLTVGPGKACTSRGPTRREFVALTAAAAGGIAAGSGSIAHAEHVPETPTAKRPPPEEKRTYSPPETVLAFRNHGMPLEMLREPITPLGMHFLLIHFDVPRLDPASYALTISGRVHNPMVMTLDDIRARPAVTEAVLLECAGNGRSLMYPRAIYVPWTIEAVGTYQYTGTPLRPLLEEAGLLDDAVEVLFTGYDVGVDLGVEHAFERSLPVDEALRDGVILAYEANGQPLLPQHGYPLRLIVPDWYGMASVKWLRQITVLDRPFEGVEQKKVYRLTKSADDPGEPVTKKWVRSLMAPPGIPDLVSRHRFVPPGRHELQGMAWSGFGPVVRVEVSADGGNNWRETELSEPVSPYAWTPWRTFWEVSSPGEYELTTRATDAAGNTQPLDPNQFWNIQGMASNGLQRVAVTVQDDVGIAGMEVPGLTRPAVAGAQPPSPPLVASP